MKKTMFIMTLVLTLAASLAFAEDNADRKTSDVTYNGITYFNAGHESRMPETALPMVKSGETPFNGITYFNQDQPGTAKRNYSASAYGEKGQTPEKKPHNGITAFE